MNEESIKIIKSQLIDFCDNVLNYKKKTNYKILNNHEIFEHDFNLNNYKITFCTIKHVSSTEYDSGFGKCYIDENQFFVRYSQLNHYNIKFQQYIELFDKSDFFNKMINSDIDCNLDYEFYSFFKDLILMQQELKNNSICKDVEISVVKTGENKDE